MPNGLKSLQSKKEHIQHVTSVKEMEIRKHTSAYGYKRNIGRIRQKTMKLVTYYKR